MAVVEFDVHGRTYQVDLAHLQSDNVHSLNLIRDSVTISTDLKTNQKVFISWADIPVMRIIS